MMNDKIWPSECLLGIPEMDNEHCLIVDMIRRLETAEGRPDALACAFRVVRDLAGYVTTHFTHEEDLLARSGYPDLEAHRETHRRFTEAVAGLSSTADIDHAKVRVLLADWLRTHVMDMDRRYVPHVQSWLDRRDDGHR
ncbi:MAG: bacteriohemerythrin [Telmatospirillum sp.]|nr:bacteriohemerythrin [Telmatospirillum sp.]